jgi:hypothetical protein
VRNLPAGAPLPGRARPWRVRAVALAVSGSNLTVWRLTGAAAVWSKIQKIGVPIQNGSSS